MMLNDRPLSYIVAGDKTLIVAGDTSRHPPTFIERLEVWERIGVVPHNWLDTPEEQS